MGRIVYSARLILVDQVFVASSGASARSEPTASSDSSFAVYVAAVGEALACTVRGHAWRLEQLKRGPTRVEVCRRCGAVEPYFDLFKQLSPVD
jgi:hypothetical protein